MHKTIQSEGQIQGILYCLHPIRGWSPGGRGICADAAVVECFLPTVLLQETIELDNIGILPSNNMNYEIHKSPCSTNLLSEFIRSSVYANYEISFVLPAAYTRSRTWWWHALCNPTLDLHTSSCITSSDMSCHDRLVRVWVGCHGSMRERGAHGLWVSRLSSLKYPLNSKHGTIWLGVIWIYEQVEVS